MTTVGIAVKYCNPAMVKVLCYAGTNLDLSMKRSYGAHQEKEGHLFHDDGEFNALQQALFTRSSRSRNVDIECVKYVFGKCGIDAKMTCNDATQVVVTKMAEAG